MHIYILMKEKGKRERESNTNKVIKEKTEKNILTDVGQILFSV